MLPSTSKIPQQQLTSHRRKIFHELQSKVNRLKYGKEGRRKMKYGFTIHGTGPLSKPEYLVALVKRGEELGYHSALLGDHIVVPNSVASHSPYSPDGSMPGLDKGDSLEQLTVLAFLAGQTQEIRLVTGVMVLPYRNPLVAAKVLATLDVLSHGRLTVGIGSGWMEEEFEALGCPPFSDRGAVTDEYIRMFKELWTSENPSYQGKYFQFSSVKFLPKPVQKPHPPIWVGGESPAALRRAATLGNGWYPLGSNNRFPFATPQDLADAIKRLSDLAQRAGRDLSEIEIIFLSTPHYLIEDGGKGGHRERIPLTGSPEEIASDIRTYEKMGVSQLNIDVLSDTLDGALEQMESFATQVWPQV